MTFFIAEQKEHSSFIISQGLTQGQTSKVWLLRQLVRFELTGEGVTDYRDYTFLAFLQYLSATCQRSEHFDRLTFPLYWSILVCKGAISFDARWLRIQEIAPVQILY
jgi:hypothetical protein